MANTRLIDESGLACLSPTPPPPVVSEDCPWTVGIAENPHDPTSYILYVQSIYLITMKKSLHFSNHLWRSIRDLVKANFFVRVLVAS